MGQEGPQPGSEAFDVAVRRFANRMLGSSPRKETVDLTHAFFGEAVIRQVSDDGALMAHLAAVTILAKRLGEDPEVVAASVNYLIRCAATGPADGRR